MRYALVTPVTYLGWTAFDQRPCAAARPALVVPVTPRHLPPTRDLNALGRDFNAQRTVLAGI